MQIILRKEFPKLPNNLSWKVLAAASESGNKQLIEILLEDKRIDPKSILKKKSFNVSSEILQTLLNDPRVEMPRVNPFVMRLCELTDGDSLAVIMKDSRVELGPASLETMIERAAVAGCLAPLTTILTDPRSDLLEKKTEYLERAIESQNFPVVEYIFRWVGRDPAVYTNQDTIIKAATELGNVDIFSFLIEKGFRFKPIVLVRAASRGYIGIVERTAALPDCAKHLNKALVKACAKGQTDIVKFLLSHTPANPGHKNSLCLFKACENCVTDIVNILLEDKRVKISDSDYRALSVYVADLASKWHNIPFRTENEALLARLVIEAAFEKTKWLVLATTEERSEDDIFLITDVVNHIVIAFVQVLLDCGPERV